MKPIDEYKQNLFELGKVIHACNNNFVDCDPNELSALISGNCERLKMTNCIFSYEQFDILTKKIEKFE